MHDRDRIDDAYNSIIKSKLEYFETFMRQNELENENDNHICENINQLYTILYEPMIMIDYDYSAIKKMIVDKINARINTLNKNRNGVKYCCYFYCCICLIYYLIAMQGQIYFLGLLRLLYIQLCCGFGCCCYCGCCCMLEYDKKLGSARFLKDKINSDALKVH